MWAGIGGEQEEGVCVTMKIEVCLSVGWGCISGLVMASRCCDNGEEVVEVSWHLCLFPADSDVTNVISLWGKRLPRLYITFLHDIAQRVSILLIGYIMTGGGIG